MVNRKNNETLNHSSGMHLLEASAKKDQSKQWRRNCPSNNFVKPSQPKGCDT